MLVVVAGKVTDFERLQVFSHIFSKVLEHKILKSVETLNDIS